MTADSRDVPADGTPDTTGRPVEDERVTVVVASRIVAMTWR